MSMTFSPVTDWLELDYRNAIGKLSESSSGTSIETELPDDFDGEYFSVWYGTLDGQDYTFCEVSGAYENAGIYYAVGKFDPEIALNDLLITSGYYEDM